MKSATSTGASSSSSNSAPQQPRRRPNSFASATASSLAHGGPATMAPKNRPLPKMDKENTDGTTTSQLPTTPNRRGTKPAEGESVLSPTPYHEVLAERNGETSPRMTRSASKRKMIQNLNVLDDTLSPEGDNNNHSVDQGIGVLVNRGTLQFESPTAFCATRHQPPIKNERVGERRNPMRDPSPAGRRAKKPRTSVAAASPGVSTEEMRKVMTDVLASDQSSKLEAALEEKGKIQTKYEEMCARYSELEKKFAAKSDNEKIRVELECAFNLEREQWEGEKERLESKVVELRQQNVEYIEQLTDLEGRCTNQYSNERNDEWEMKYNDCHKELAQVRVELETVRKEKVLASAELDDKRNELEKTTSELNCIQEEIEEMATELSEAQGELEEANHKAKEMEKIQVGNDEAAAEVQEKLTALQGELNAAQTDLDAKADLISNLESSLAKLESDKTTTQDQASELQQSLEAATQDLECVREELKIAQSKLQGVQSPRSRSALEEEHQQEVSMVRNRVSTLESRLNVKEDELANLIEEKNAAKDELKACMSECEGLCDELEETQSQLADEKKKVAQIEDQFTSQLNGMETKLKTVTDDKVEADQLLDELAVENEGLMQKWEETKVELQTSQSEAAALTDRIMQMDEVLNEEKKTRVQIEQQYTRAQENIAELEGRISSLEQELTESQHLVKENRQEKAASDAKISDLSSQLTTVTAHLTSVKSDITVLQSQLKAKQHYCDNFEKTERELLSENHMLNEIRRNLHNRVIQLSGNIRVFVRVRPMIESELLALADGQSNTGSRPSSRNGPASRPSSRNGRKSTTSNITTKKAEIETDISPFHFPSIAAERSTSSDKKGTSYSDLTKQVIEIVEPYKDRGGLNPRQKKWKYGFDRVYQPNQTQDDIWEGAEPLVQSCLDGFNVCMFAYGQTGSGKTHTMIGDSKNQGLIPRSVQLFFDTKASIEKKCKAQEQDVNIDISVELLEIYNEEVRDLLSPNAGSNGKLLKVDLNSHEAVGNSLVSVSCKQDVDNVLQLAQSRRCVKATKSNAESSRSHLLFTIHFKVSSGTNEDLIRNGCLHIIDLAGSERVDKSGSVGALLTEAKHINKSLSALTGVIEKLQEKSTHIPYRDSKLTYLLRNSLGGDSKTLAIVCCSPLHDHFHESHNSIRFAAKASKVELKEGNKVDV